MTSSEKKEYLLEYKNTKRRIKRIELQIEEIREAKMNPSAKTDDMPHAHNITDLSDYIINLDDKLSEIIVLKSKNAALLEKIYKAVDELEDEVEKDIIIYRYVRGMSWEDIAKEIGYSRKQTDRIHGRALEHLVLEEENDTGREESKNN